MKPFKPNKQQLEAISNGCTKLWIPLSKFIHLPDFLLDLKHVQEVGDFTEEKLLKRYSPLQPNEEYFVQEELACPGDCNMSAPCQVCGSNGQFIGTALTIIAKFTVTGVEVKSVYELNLMESTTYEMGCYASSYREWHDSQYPEQPYSSNPYGFLVGIERID